MKYVAINFYDDEVWVEFAEAKNGEEQSSSWQETMPRSFFPGRTLNQFFPRY